MASRSAAPRPKKPARPEILDAYEVVDVHRSELKSAPYNPRVMSDKERIKLRRGIEKHGFVAPPVWNVRTGNLVGGHQRMSIRDTLEGTKDYRLKVAKIDVDELRERELNLLLNNGEAQGAWDLGKLEEMFRVPELDIEATGFDTADVFRMFGDRVWEESANEETLKKLSETVDKASEFFEEQRKKEKRAVDDIDFYMVVVFRTRTERDDFASTLGLEPNRYQDGKLLCELLEKRSARSVTGEEEAERPPAGSEG